MAEIPLHLPPPNSHWVARTLYVREQARQALCKPGRVTSGPSIKEFGIRDRICATDHLGTEVVAHDPSIEVFKGRRCNSLAARQREAKMRFSVISYRDNSLSDDFFTMPRGYIV